MQAHADIALHVCHFAVKITRYPLCVMLMMWVELYVGDPDLLKSQFEPDLFYGL